MQYYLSNTTYVLTFFSHFSFFFSFLFVIKILILQFHTGTSTGALIAYALVGGKEPEGNETHRSKMRLKGILEMYEKQIPEIFYTWKKRKRLLIPQRYVFGINPRSQKELKKSLVETFGEETKTSSINLHDGQVFAGAVTKPVEPCLLPVIFDGSVDGIPRVIFDESVQTTKVQEVLAASCDAPAYFEIPTTIEEKQFIDGGVGGMYLIF